MYRTYGVSLLLSGAIHSALFMSLTTWIEMPVINLEEAPSALEICVVGSDRVTTTGLPSEESEQQAEDVVTNEEAPLAAPPGEIENIEAIPYVPDEYTIAGASRKVERTLQEAEQISVIGDNPSLQNIQIGVDQAMKDPIPWLNPAPRYPRLSRKRGEEGMVVLDVQILADGSVGEIDIFSSSGYDRLDVSALDAVKKWQFQPARLRGLTVTVRRKVPVMFKLK